MKTKKNDLTDINGMIDKAKKLFNNGDTTLFREDVHESTTIMRNGER